MEHHVEDRQPSIEERRGGPRERLRVTLGRPEPAAARPIEKSTAGASLLAQVIVAKWADHQPLHRQEKMFERHGIDISRKTMGGWMAQCAELLDPLYQLMKKELLSSKVIGTDDTSVKVLDRKLPFARTGRIWPYVGDAQHPVIDTTHRKGNRVTAAPQQPPHAGPAPAAPRRLASLVQILERRSRALQSITLAPQL